MGNEQSLGDASAIAPGAHANGVMPEFVGASRKRRGPVGDNGSSQDEPRKWTRKPGGRKVGLDAGRKGVGVVVGVNGASTGDDGSSEDPTVPHNEPLNDESSAARKRAAAEAKFIEWAPHEDQIIRDGVQRHGFKWTLIAKELPGRTDNAVRNRWKRLEEGATWRQSMVGEGVDLHALPPDQVPGYKCRKCGQPKRGHTCPFNAPPLAPPNFEPAPIARSASGSLRLEQSASGRIPIEQLRRLIEGSLELPTPRLPAAPPAGAAGLEPGPWPGPQMRDRAHGPLANGSPHAADASASPFGQMLPPPVELVRNSSSIEKLLALSRDFSFSWLRSLGQGGSNSAVLGPSNSLPLLPSISLPSTPSALLPTGVPPLTRGRTTDPHAEAEADSIARDLQAVVDEANRGGRPSALMLPSRSGGSFALGASSSLPLPPALERNNSSSIERLLTIGKEFSMSFLTDALGVSPGKRRSSSHSHAANGDHANYVPRR